MASLEAILEPSLIEGRYRLAHHDVELTSGDVIEVQYPLTDEWFRSSVEYDHKRKAYVAFLPNTPGHLHPITLERIARLRLLVRVPGEARRYACS